MHSFITDQRWECVSVVCQLVKCDGQTLCLKPCFDSVSWKSTHCKEFWKIDFWAPHDRSQSLFYFIPQEKGLIKSQSFTLLSLATLWGYDFLQIPRWHSEKWLPQPSLWSKKFWQVQMASLACALIDMGAFCPTVVVHLPSAKSMLPYFALNMCALS